MRRSTDRKSEFLRGLKDERNGDMSDCHSPGAPAEVQMFSSLICCLLFYDWHRYSCLHQLRYIVSLLEHDALVIADFHGFNLYSLSQCNIDIIYIFMY